MTLQSSFGFENFLTLVAVITEVPRKVVVFNVVPDIVRVKVLLSTQGAFVTCPPIPSHPCIIQTPFYPWIALKDQT